MAWQQISISRLDAALKDEEPGLPAWLDDEDPFYAEEHSSEFNAHILELYKDESWSNVYQTWREGFLHFLALAEEPPEEKMHDRDRYKWHKGYALSEVICGSSEHHEEHLEEISEVSE
jgi:hypothetical protein